MFGMFGVLFWLLMFMALLNIGVEIMMRLRLSRREAPAEKLTWWRRGGDAVSTAYQELFPNSRIPAYRSFIFWSVVVYAGSLLVAILLKSR
jgi:hypothetical protein